VECHETVRDAEFVHRGEHLVVQRLEVSLRATGRERRVGEERDRDERGQGQHEAECSLTVHMFTVGTSKRGAMGRLAQIREGEVLLLQWSRPGPVRQNCTTMSLRSEPLEQEVTLPDGRVIAVRVGIAEDSYIPRRELDTVVLELWDEGRGEHLAGVATVLSADDVGAARALLREAVAGLGDGSLAPTAGALEPLADSVPPQ